MINRNSSIEMKIITHRSDEQSAEKGRAGRVEPGHGTVGGAVMALRVVDLTRNAPSHNAGNGTLYAVA